MDATSAFATALAASDVVLVPEGTFKANIVMPPYKHLIGAGRYLSKIIPAAAGPVITVAEADNLILQKGGIHSLWVYGDTADATNDGIYLKDGPGTAAGHISGSYDYLMQNLLISNCGRHGLHIEGGDIYQAQQWSTYDDIICEYNVGCGMKLYGFVQNNDFRHVHCRYNGSHGMWIDRYLDGADWEYANYNNFTKCEFEANGYPSLDVVAHGVLSEGQANTYVNCWFEGNGPSDSSLVSAGFYCDFNIGAESQNTFLGCRFASHKRHAYINYGDGNYFEACSFAWNGAQPAIHDADVYVAHTDGAALVMGHNYTSTPTTHVVYATAADAAYTRWRDGGPAGYSYALRDGITAPATVTGLAQIYVDTADGDLKVKYGDGTVKTIVVDT